MDEVFAELEAEAEIHKTELVEEALYQTAVLGRDSAAVQAQKFWLTNRDPGRWSDKRNLDVNQHVQIEATGLETKLEMLAKTLGVETLEGEAEEVEPLALEVEIDEA